MVTQAADTGGKLLVLTTDQVLSREVCALLETRGYVTLIAHTPDLARFALERTRFAGMLCDVRGGSDFTRWVSELVTRGRQANPALQVLLLVQRQDPPEAVARGKLAVAGVPIDPEELAILLQPA